VSFYNESGDSAVYPTPVVGMVGLLEDYRLMIRPGFPSGGLTAYVLGKTRPELGGSEFAEAILGKVAGRPPALDLAAEARLHQLLCECAREDLLASAHDISDGGLAVALAESAMAGGVGFTVSLPAGGLLPHVAMFSESASRAVVTARAGREADVEQLAGVHRVPITRLGLTGGSRLEFADLFDVPLSDAVVVYEGAIPRLMSEARLAG
jgi:phosphoribosylformylglycinamidine (FGAM) synthase-like enzyme